MEAARLIKSKNPHSMYLSRLPDLETIPAARRCAVGLPVSVSSSHWPGKTAHKSSNL